MASAVCAGMINPTLQQVVRAGFAQFCATHGVRRAAIRWAYAVMACRTSALGGHVWRCPEGHEHRVWWNSCKHRACPQCSGMDRERWLADQVLGASRETLLQLLAQPRWLGALPGIVLSWQTWGRNLITHPHVHALVTAGGWTGSGWKSLKHDYLVPTAVLRSVYRGKLRTRLLSLAFGEMVLPEGWTDADVRQLLKRLYRKEWCVHVQPRYRHGGGVLMYLARYVRGGPLREHQLQALTDTHVTFRYTDHRDQRTKPMRLPVTEFLLRLTAHVPEPGSHVVRYAGLYASGHRAVLAQARAALGMAPLAEAPAYLTAQDYLERIGHGGEMTCSVCGRRYVQQTKIEPSGRAPPIEEYRDAA